MSAFVLDASAVVNQETGHELVADAIAAGASISAVNFAEVVTRLQEAGVSDDDIHSESSGTGP